MDRGMEERIEGGRESRWRDGRIGGRRTGEKEGGKVR